MFFFVKNLVYDSLIKLRNIPNYLPKLDVFWLGNLSLSVPHNRNPWSSLWSLKSWAYQNRDEVILNQWNYRIGCFFLEFPLIKFTQNLIKVYFELALFCVGEYFLNDPENGTTMMGTPARYSWQEPIGLVYFGIYLLIANVLILNLLIAIFSNTYGIVIAKAERTWAFKR